MKLSIIVTTILNMFATSPDLCAEPYLDPYGTPCTDSIGQTRSRYCKWTGPDAPLLDANVCCTIDGDGATPHDAARLQHMGDPRNQPSSKLPSYIPVGD
jgi:hypothetical protein